MTWPGWEKLTPASMVRHVVAPLPKPHKYHARKTRAYDGTMCDSTREADRWNVLCLLKNAGHLLNLEPHPRFDLIVNGIKVGHYTADSRYVTHEGEVVIEDVKSEPTKTTAYRLRKRLFEACHYPLTVTEV